MPAQEIPETNKTSLGLYATPSEAYEMWKADPDGVHFLDVRTFEEYIFGGHVEVAKNVPLVFPRFDPDGPSMPGRPPGCSGEANPDFIAKVKEAFGADETILAMCATGGRGAMAVNALAQAGFTQRLQHRQRLRGRPRRRPGERLPRQAHAQRLEERRPALGLRLPPRPDVGRLREVRSAASVSCHGEWRRDRETSSWSRRTTQDRSSMCCLFSTLFLLGPRAAIVVWWIAQPVRWDAAFSSRALAGDRLLHRAVDHAHVGRRCASGGVHGLDWLWIGLGVVARRRHGVGGAKSGTATAGPRVQCQHGVTIVPHDPAQGMECR